MTQLNRSFGAAFEILVGLIAVAALAAMLVPYPGRAH